MLPQTLTDLLKPPFSKPPAQMQKLAKKQLAKLEARTKW